MKDSEDYPRSSSDARRSIVEELYIPIKLRSKIQKENTDDHNKYRQEKLAKNKA